jgi:hypothetical protein
VEVPVPAVGERQSNAPDTKSTITITYDILWDVMFKGMHSGKTARCLRDAAMHRPHASSTLHRPAKTN